MARYRCTAGILMLLVITASTFSPISCAPEEGVALIQMMTEWKVAFQSWIEGSDPCDGWQNVNCTNGRVTRLVLASLEISGTLPNQIGVLRALEYLDISDNDFHDEFPDELALCQNLFYLDISDNNWGIPFPTVLFQLPKLEYLYASTSKLQGRLTAEFFNMKSLKYLYLGNNTELMANFEDFSLLTNLVNLTVWAMKFDRYELPEKLSLLTNLYYLNLHDSNLVGSLPASYGDLKNLSVFNVRNNALTGGIPESYKKLSGMVNFRADTNFLLGPFPNWMFDLWPNLTYLYLSRNQFYGTPYNISYLENTFNITSKFQIMRWDCNYLAGPQPCGDKGNNNCSATTVAYVNSSTVVDVTRFAFFDNCYDDATVDYTQGVSYCGRHTLTCKPFYSQVVEQGICPSCPLGQEPVVGATVASGCICGESKASESGTSTGTIVGIVVGVALFFSILLVVVIWYKRKQFSFLDIFTIKRDDFDQNWEVPAGVHRFTVEELAKITSDFDDTHIIGSGGFGKVYSGTLEDGRMVAIKRAYTGTLQGHSEFRNEVTLLSRLHHRHLVKLEGFCAEKDFQVLVYEFMKKGNLANHLYGDPTKVGEAKTKEDSFTPLPWYKRLEIAYGVAQGLEYLHSFAAPSVIHRDVKPSNILLDENMLAKLADFGISKEFGSEEANNTHLSTRPAGTAGYLDPEYFLRRQLTTASDVYAFGVVLLELITGQVAIDHNRDDEYNLVEWVKKRFKTAGIIAIVDPKISDDYSKEAFTQITELALRCASFSKNERPTMKDVLAAMDPLLPKTSKASTTDRDPSFTETDWLLAKRELFHKFDLKTGSTGSSTQPSSGSDTAQTLNVMDLSKEFVPR